MKGERTMNKITSGDWEFEIVDHVPPGYIIWNIGKNMIDGYLPLCRLAAVQPFPGGRSIETHTLKAIKTEHAQTILAAIGIGPGTVKEMEDYIKKHPNKWGVDRMKAALPHMRDIKGL
jgi:hypothetical protein